MPNKPTYKELSARVEELESTVQSYQQRLVDSQNAEARSRTLFDHLLYEVHVWDLVRDDSGEIKTWSLADANPAALEVWGKAREEVIGKLANDIFPGGDPTEQFLPVVNKLFETGEPEVWENYFPGSDQTLLMISIPVGEQFISSGVDVSPMKRIEQELQETVIRLTETIDAGNVGLWDWDLKTDTVHFSKEYKSQIGYDDDEISDDFDEWQSRVHPEDLATALSTIEQSLTSDSKTHQAEFRFRHKDGSYRWIFAHASILRDESGAPSRMVGSHIDITDRKDMERAFQQSQKMEALGTLAGGIAHDFNNLLTPILGYSELLKRKHLTGEKELKYVERIEKAATRAKELVQNILIISRRSVSEKESASIVKLLNEVLAIVNVSAPKNVTVSSRCPKDLPNILANHTKIYQVILNLCTNALQAMEQGGELKLTLGLEPSAPNIIEALQAPDGYVCLTIEDTGQGMDEITISKMFDPFYTTKTQGEKRGTGLGLSIVMGVIEEHSGDITVTSRLGKGTRFDVYLPASSTAERSAASIAEASLPALTGSAILVDDDAMVRETTAAMLETLGLEVTAFADGEKALACLRQKPDSFTLLITDYSMPELSGFEVVRRANAIRKDLPIILVTGYSNLAGKQDFPNLGCNTVLSKPFECSGLEEAVREALSAVSDAAPG